MHTKAILITPSIEEYTMQASMDFVYQARPARVVFGAGSFQQLEREVLMLGAKRALVLCTPEQRPGAEAIRGMWP